jgi:hypothetical protein
MYQCVLEIISTPNILIYNPPKLILVCIAINFALLLFAERHTLQNKAAAAL